MIDAASLKAGDVLWDSKAKVVIVVTLVGGYHGDEVTFDELKGRRIAAPLIDRLKALVVSTFPEPTRMGLVKRACENEQVAIRFRMQTFKQFGKRAVTPWSAP